MAPLALNVTTKGYVHNNTNLVRGLISDLIGPGYEFNHLEFTVVGFGFLV